MSATEDRPQGQPDEVGSGRSRSQGPFCSYSTSQPAPTQWVAVGVVAPSERDGISGHRMLVGKGRTEAAAVRALRRRCQWQAAG